MADGTGFKGHLRIFFGVEKIPRVKVTVALPVAGVDDFIKGKKNVRKLDSSEIELNIGQIPEDMEIVVLQPAL